MLTKFVDDKKAESLDTIDKRRKKVKQAIAVEPEMIPIDHGDVGNRSEDVQGDSEVKLFNIVEMHIQHILLKLTLMFSKPSKGITSDLCKKYGPLYKKAYSISLQLVPKEDKLHSIVPHLIRILTEISEIVKQIPDLNL